MMSRRYVAFLLASSVVSAAWGQTTINGDLLPFQSNGEADGAGWTLGNNVIGGGDESGNGVSSFGDGYVGTYVQVPATGGQVTFNINASGVESDGMWPDMTLSVAGQNTSFSVNSADPNQYTATVDLPGDLGNFGNHNATATGTYMVRLQLDNQTNAATPLLNVNSLQVSGTGVSVQNQNTNALALSSAQTYADSFRAGNATINFAGLGAGTPVSVKLISNNFTFAAAASGINQGDPSVGSNPAWLVPNPAPGTYAYNYQQAILQNFNGLIPSNAGKWGNNEPTQGNLSQLSFLDEFAQFAQQHGLTMRMHNLIWDTQQPAFVTNLFSTISGGGSAGAAAQASLSAAIQNRINYYVSGTNTLTNNIRTQNYSEMDVLNEAFHGGGTSANYFGTYGAAGIANIYNEVASAVQAAGANTRLYTNEFNVFQNSVNPLISRAPSDPYANWYLAEIQDIRNAGGAVTGVGAEDYVNTDTNAQKSSPYTTSGLQEALQTLSVAGLPLTLSEFGEENITGGASGTTTAVNTLTETMTMIYGTPQATTMGFWGDLGGPGANTTVAGALLYDSNFNLTAVGKAYQAWQAQYDTNLNLVTGPDGQINFRGTYGTYLVTVDGKNYDLDFEPNGQSTFTIAVPEPASLGALAIGALAALGRRSRSRCCEVKK